MRLFASFVVNFFVTQNKHTLKKSHVFAGNTGGLVSQTGEISLGRCPGEVKGRRLMEAPKWTSKDTELVDRASRETRGAPVSVRGFRVSVESRAGAGVEVHELRE